MNTALFILERKAREVAKAIAAVVAPMLVAGAFAALDALNAADLPTEWRVVVGIVVSATAVYRTKNLPKLGS
jgi:expansin (peptidoglycan-binding protein)